MNFINSSFLQSFPIYLQVTIISLNLPQIARENPEIEREMLVAVEEVLNTGQAMSTAAREFANDPCSSVKRGNMVRLISQQITVVRKLCSVLTNRQVVYKSLQSIMGKGTIGNCFRISDYKNSMCDITYYDTGRRLSDCL